MCQSEARALLLSLCPRRGLQPHHRDGSPHVAPPQPVTGWAGLPPRPSDLAVVTAPGFRWLSTAQLVSIPWRGPMYSRCPRSAWPRGHFGVQLTSPVGASARGPANQLQPPLLPGDGSQPSCSRIGRRKGRARLELTASPPSCVNLGGGHRMGQDRAGRPVTSEGSGLDSQQPQQPPRSPSGRKQTRPVPLFRSPTAAWG